MNLFNYKSLYETAITQKPFYQSNTPFPHIVLDGLLDEVILSEALSKFPSPFAINWYRYANALEKKLAYDNLDQIPNIFREILLEFTSGQFIKFLEFLTGIEGLICDPHFRGGGLHQIERGGKLDIHADFNWHEKLKLIRRVNVLIYLNKNWFTEYGGNLELWDSKMKECRASIEPVFNRMVIFNTDDSSFHGHPDILQCPPEMTRKSLAIYYYTSGKATEKHSTVYVARPGDDLSLDQLRIKRSKGRIT